MLHFTTEFLLYEQALYDTIEQCIGRGDYYKGAKSAITWINMQQPNIDTIKYVVKKIDSANSLSEYMSGKIYVLKKIIQYITFTNEQH